MQKYSTKQRETLLKLLSDNADKPMSAGDIAAALNGEGISISAIYRNLSALEDEDRVQRLTLGGSKKVYYRFTGAKGCEKHLHLSCHKCGQTFHMDVPATNSLIDEVLSGSDFKVDSANTVLYGVCSKCRKGC
ncbi:MAG: transcriptional repressor [Clostridia bacterium]|nr:transcriptional repressor [Clostridia bacterium]